MSPLSSAILKHELVARLTYADNDRIAFWVINNAEMPGPEYADLEYMFSRDFKVLQVKSTSVTEALYKRLVQQGRLTGSLDKKYLENLRDGIRYWDGEDWVREAVKVKHRPPIAERQ